jgi:hypothetical protein
MRAKIGQTAFTLAAGGLLLAGLFLLAAGTSRVVRAEAGTLFVQPAGSGTGCTQPAPCDLHTALAQAVDGDTIYVAAGTYIGTGAAVITVTKSVTLYGGWDGTVAMPPLRDHVAYPTILDGQGQRRVVIISANSAPTLDGFTITGGQASFSGGGIMAENASPVIHNNVISGNSAAGDGGAIFINRGSAQIHYNLIVNNSAAWAGGLRIINDAEATIVGNEIANNVAAISGGAINVACCGGATSIIAQNWIVNNDGGGAGGGVMIDGVEVELVNNILAENQAHDGAGVWLEGTDSIPAGAALINNTLVGRASGDQAVWVGAYVTATLANNILAGHATGITNTAPASSTVSADHNLFWNTSDPIVGSNPLYADPLLDANYHLLAGSPARDAGIPVDLDVDFDGDPRPVNTLYDIGADEYVLRVHLPLVERGNAQ